MTQTHTYNERQAQIIREYVRVYELDPSQITFDGNDSTSPIFDHNAVSVLSLRLTDLKYIGPTKVERGPEAIAVFGIVDLPDGRSRGWIGMSEFGEVLANGEIVDNPQVALGVATSRGFRQGIRNVGINLHAAHKHFMQTGETAAGHTEHNPNAAVQREIHVLAEELDFIIDGDKTRYREYLAENYEGRTSASDLTDIERQKLLIQFRSLARLKRAQGPRQAA